METVCDPEKCTGCMACTDICPKNAIELKDSIRSLNAVKLTDKCINCKACEQVCPVNHPIEKKEPFEWHQGWANDDAICAQGSSGGVASAIAYHFVETGGTVCSCAFQNGEFTFCLTDNTEELHKFAGSKYVKSNPMGAYRATQTALKSGKKVLFIGLPCQVAAAKKFLKRNFDNFFSIDLICHGTPSVKLLEKFLNQYELTLSNLDNIQFRRKTSFSLSDGEKTIACKGTSDHYSIAFLSGLTYTENCYECQYAQWQRVSDITLGDSWGSMLENKNGLSLILCQTEKGKKLLEESDLHLEEVDIQTAVAHNHQLTAPMTKPNQKDAFFDGIDAGKNFNRLVFSALPKKCIRQKVKAILIKTGILKR